MDIPGCLGLLLSFKGRKPLGESQQTRLATGSHLGNTISELSNGKSRKRDLIHMAILGRTNRANYFKSISG